MKILITGANGFVGKNLVSALEYSDDIEILSYTRKDTEETLSKYTKDCDFVVHLAGVNRSENVKDFYDVNQDLTKRLIDSLITNNNMVPILISSSIQSALDNDYGISKKAGEELVLEYSREYDVPVYIYKLPNLFGKWSKPFYNSVIATWAHQISRDEEISISDPNYEITFVYIDDYIEEIKNRIFESNRMMKDEYFVEPTYTKSLKEVSDLMIEFKESRINRFISDMSDDFTRKLYSTYLSYLDEDNFKYDLITHSDDRGSFTEILKSYESGQVSINVNKAYETKGEHFHHTKTEKFIVVKGKASIKFRNIFDNHIIELVVSDKKLEVVDIPPGYTHNITNLLDEDLITVMWVNEPYDPKKSDTFIKEVKE